LFFAPVSLASAMTQGVDRSWPEEKCLRYKRAWEQAKLRLGLEGLTTQFQERHDAFIAGGCQAKADVCPRSAKDFDFANIMTLQALNAGMSGSFLPFSCRTQ
jgi:hypothetical protein